MQHTGNNTETNNIGKSAMKAGLWYTISTICTKAVLIFTTPIFTRVLTQEDYGISATFTSWFSLLSVFASLNLMYSIGRAKIDYKDDLHRFVGSLYTLSALFMSIIAVIMLAFRNKIGGMMELSSPLVILLTVYLLCSPVVEFKQALYKYEYRYVGNILISIIITLGTIFTTFALIFVLDEERYYARVIGTILPVLILAFIFWHSAIKRKEINFNTTYWKYALKISLPLILNTVSLHIMAQSDRIMITKFTDTVNTAIYTLAYQYATMINIVLDSIGKAWLPWFHDSLAVGNKKEIRKNTKILFNFGALVGIGCISLAPEAIYILGGKSYMIGQYVVCPLILGIVCRFMFVQFEHIELHLKKTQYTAIGTTIAAVINVCLNLLFIPRFGFIAAAYTTLISYFCLMVIHYIFTRYIMKVDLYDIKHMFILFLCTSLISIGFVLLYDYILIRLLLDVMLVSLFAFRYRKILLDYLNGKVGKNEKKKSIS